MRDLVRVVQIVRVVVQELRVLVGSPVQSQVGELVQLVIV